MQHLPTIQIRVIPQAGQRYKTIGDYWLDEDGVLQVRISACSDASYEFPVLLHELVEWFLFMEGGGRLLELDAFDFQYERERAAGKHADEEPGDDPRAPYRQAHRFAENLERHVVHELGLAWTDYDAEITRVWARR